jgi:hypothetical protein
MIKKGAVALAFEKTPVRSSFLCSFTQIQDDFHADQVGKA